MEGLLIGIVSTVVGGLILWFFTERKKNKQKGLPTEPASQVISIEKYTEEVPNNLPGRNYFIGRKLEIEEINRALASRDRIVNIHGIGGFGKSALALEVSHIILKKLTGGKIDKKIIVPEIKHKYYQPNAIIWFTGRNIPATLERLYDEICKTLKYDYLIRLPFEEKQENVFRILRSLKCLLIIDNFDTISDQRFLTFLSIFPEPSKVIITSRHNNVSNALSIPLIGLDSTNALKLIRNEAQRVKLVELNTCSDDKLLPLIETTASAPLALKWAIGQMKQKGQSYNRVLTRIKNREGDIFEEIFSRSWNILTDNSRDVIIALGTFNSLVSGEALKSTVGLDELDFEKSINQLQEMSLIEAYWSADTDVTKYSVVFLVRAFTQGIMKKDHLLDNKIKGGIISWAQGVISKFGDKNWEDYDWNWERYKSIDNEIDNLLGGLDLAYELEKWIDLLELTKGLIHYFGVRGLLNERVTRSQTAISAARILVDEESEAWLYVAGFGWTYIQQGLFEIARTVLEKGCNIAERKKMTSCLAEAYQHRGIIELENHSYLEAENYFRKSLSLASVPRIKARVHCSIGRLAEKKQDYNTALSEYITSIELSRNANDYWGRLITPLYIGDLELVRNNYLAAKKWFEESLNQANEFQAFWVITEAQFGLAKIYFLLNEFSAALDLCEECTHGFEKLGMKDRRTMAFELLNSIPK
jgi:tetratricopeptide (TPR) repeat protein